MKLIKDWWNTWRQDKVLGLVIRNTSYLFSSTTISMGLTSLMGFVTAIMLGPENYGSLGMIILFASSVNRLLSFRMGELVVKYAGHSLTLENKEHAAAVIKAAAIAEGLTSVAAFLILLLLTPLAATYILKDSHTQWLIAFYGISVLGSLITETSTAVLQISNHYRTQAAMGLLQTVVTAAGIGYAYFSHGGLNEILVAYLFGKMMYGIGMMAFAYYWLNHLLGKNWIKAPFSLLDRRREMVHFAVSTNLSGTINMVIRDSEVLWAGFFLTRLEAGYYKFALAVMNIVLMPITPFINTTYPEITKAVAKLDWTRLRLLLRRTTLIAAAWTIACFAGVLLLGQFVLQFIKQGAYLPSFPIIIILLLGYGIANVFFWSRPLLLAFEKPNYPLKVNFASGALKTVMMFILVPLVGVPAQAALLSFYFLSSVGLIVRKGLGMIHTAEENSLEKAAA
jgi:O-antigen/teichoic acid export membrane protein